ncbi:MAG: hypothetical protein B7Z68_05825 [Acidobacteria bacterium 21-70-11]|nr:MAG: hypothetical protein B7Z68_05825 [Acidobacteria bacterium 21-70-11]OYW03446.1 MAG: hypothetical protein B7Z61_10705 [Acidobacteria bacterium 37-71-11]HQT94488.1 DUF5668 domain-containing protein [Thermoanaerobaculaceae bacterium]HQU33877.1 DUF5668 domain-containing protein [Thermoanaerobaculaceae bacterium]
MGDERVRRNAPRLILGLLIIGLGILFTLDKLGYVDAGSVWQYWPVVLIAVGLGRVLQPRACHGRGFGVVLIVVGAWILLFNVGVINHDVWDYWPILLVLLGISMVFRAVGGPGSGWRGRRAGTPPVGGGESATPGAAARAVAGQGATTTPADDASATVDCFALLGASRRSSVSQDFRGGSLTALMGGCELDLRQASIRSGQATIDTFAMWGGIEIKVPQDWTVALHGTPILGGFDDKTARMGGDGSKVLVVTGVAIMGGVEIKN